MAFEPSERSIFELIQHSAREVDEAIEALRRATAALHSSCLDLVAWAERGRAGGGRRAGIDRRAGSDRRLAAPVGLAARIVSSTERRHRPERRSGFDRRGMHSLAR